MTEAIELVPFPKQLLFNITIIWLSSVKEVNQMYNKILLLLLILGCCGLGSFTEGKSAAAEKDILQLVYPTFPPFHWRDADGIMHGIFYEIITEALERRLDQPVAWISYPWARCQENVKMGKADALLTVPTEERNSYTASHKTPFFEKPLHLFTSATHPRFNEIKRIRTLADIKELNLSVITYTGNGWHNVQVRTLGIPTHETSYLENVWIMLEQHRGDLVIEWPGGARPDIIRLGFEETIVDTGVEIGKMPFFLLIRKTANQAPLLDRFDEIIADMIRDGTLAAIIKKYE